MKMKLTKALEELLEAMLEPVDFEDGTSAPGMLQGKHPHVKGAASDLADAAIKVLEDHLATEKQERVDGFAAAALAGVTAANRYNKADPYTVARKAYIIATRMEEARTKINTKK